MIADLNFHEQSLLFANLAQIAYMDKKAAKKAVKAYGFTDVEFYELDGAQAYRFQNKTDMVIACRGTQPNEFNDIKADLKAVPVVSETVSRVHMGFKKEVDELWPMVLEDLKAPGAKHLDVWFTGHSLGAAMTTIMASRCNYDNTMPDIDGVFTFGSPRVGWKKYCKSLNVPHHRWVNNNDIVTRVPLAAMGYTHHGEEHYMNAHGLERKMSGWQRIKDRWRGMKMGWKSGSIDSFSDHSMVNYIANLEKIIEEGKNA